MSRRGGTSGAGGATAQRRINLNASASKKRPSFTPGPPLRPQRKMLVVLLACFVAWVGVLLALYFTTIYPRHAPGDLRAPEAQQMDAS